MIHSIDVHALRAQTIFVEHVKHHRVVIVSAAPLTMKHVTAVLMIVAHVLPSPPVAMGHATGLKIVPLAQTIVAHVLPSPPVAMGHATGLKIVPLAQTIVGHVLPSPPVAIGSVMVQRIVAHVLETVVDPAETPRVPKDKVWMATGTVCRLHPIVRLRCLEVYGPVQNVVAQVEPC
jgi:hypothetical protein